MNKEVVRVLISRIADRDRLRTLLREADPSRDFSSLVSEVNYDDQLSELVDKACRTGWFPQLMDIMIDYTEDEADQRTLKQFSSDYRKEKSASTVKKSARIIIDNTDNVEFIQRIAVSENYIKDVLHNLEWLSVYKSLHDCLHDVAFSKYDLIVSCMNEFFEKNRPPREIRYYVTEIRKHVASARIGLSNTRDGDQRKTEEDLLKELEKRIGEIASINERPATAQEAVILLKQIITHDMQRLDNEMGNSARNLRIDRLIQKLNELNENTNSDEISRLAEQLGDLHEEIRTRIQLHNKWQMASRFFWQIDDLIEKEEIEIVKPLLKRLVEIMSSIMEIENSSLDAKTIIDGENLKTHIDLWGQLDEEKRNEMRDKYQSFKSDTVYEFFMVDRELYGLCEEIVELRGPLQIMINKIAGEA